MTNEARTTNLRSPAPPGRATDTLSTWSRRIAVVAVTLAIGTVAYAQGASDPIVFSVDAGSDKEVSDPAPTFNEGFDPGDGYGSGSGAVVYPGRDGGIDDATLLGIDVNPLAPDTGLMTGIPFGGCAGIPEFCFRAYFDMDGLDIVNTDLTAFIDPDNAVAVGEKIWRDFDFPSASSRTCIQSARFLAVSLDDDDADSWLNSASAPVTSASPGGTTYGTTIGRDEVVAVTMRQRAVGLTPSHRITARTSIASETELHPDLGANPDTLESDDDDVDALDVPVTGAGCDVILFSPDHEADYAMSPGTIYQYDPSTATMQALIRPDVHLGLSASTDIDAFELVWIKAEAAGGGAIYKALALLFSVDEDDSTSAPDESGGLSAGTMYGSFLDGGYFVVARYDDDEDLDGIGASRNDLDTWERQQGDDNP